MVQSHDFEAALALSRFGLGSGSYGWHAAGGDARAALKHEIKAGSAALRIDAPLLSTPELLTQYYDYTQAVKALRKQTPPDDGSKLPNPVAERNLDEIGARFNTAVMKPRIGFNERLVMFWANHFAVATDKSSPIRITAGAFEREAIRPNVFGSFKDLVMAVETHPCMLTYLDNISSIGPQSRHGRSSRLGLNENLAREIMELHILGVGSGYTQADVTAFAAALTGWSVKSFSESSEGAGDGFNFIDTNHQPGEQTVLGKVYPDSGFFQAADILIDLASRPATARHITFKLARHFVADVPPPALVDRLMENFLATGGDLASVYETLIESDEAWNPACVKIRSPQEHLAAMIRTSGVTIRPQTEKQALYVMGQSLWTPSGPNGFPDTFAAWATPEGLSTRLDVTALIAAQIIRAFPGHNIDPRELAARCLGPRLTDATLQAISHAETVPQGLSLVFMSPEFLRR
ncbi:DUF1800 domain-containing protein [Asticcacaulis sp.]|uniref:DUF1800 domain-containing protein n=1 Tax=Asticcacaulis sp. TaxID=1872648 RepID=UPI002CAB2261|nr:DUF1800 family protein [Asticcacaulis sp.]HTM79894.1 DUF1800 family protein [Asticcacaulis sp.]